MNKRGKSDHRETPETRSRKEKRRARLDQERNFLRRRGKALKETGQIDDDVRRNLRRYIDEFDY